VGAAAGGVGGLLMATEKNSGKSESRWRFLFFYFLAMSVDSDREKFWKVRMHVY